MLRLTSQEKPSKSVVSAGAQVHVRRGLQWIDGQKDITHFLNLVKVFSSTQTMIFPYT